MRVYIAILMVVAALSAITHKAENPGRSAEVKVHDGNQVEMCISNVGKFGQTENQGAGCWWPKGSNHNYIFGAGVWFGTIDSLTGDTLVTIFYGPHGAETEVVPGLYGMSQSHPDAIIFMYPENFPPPDSSLPMAPQDTISNEDSWTCFNDMDSTAHVPGDTRPIGLEVYQTCYVWDYSVLTDVFYFCYDIKNVSGHDLTDCYIGVCTDCDIGNEAGTGNDRMAGIVKKNYAIGTDTFFVDDIAYQWQEEIEPGSPPWAPGVIGFDLLQTPFDLVPGQDKDGDGIPDQYERDSAYYWNNVPDSLWDVDYDSVPDWRDASENPQFGMTALKRFTLLLEPNIDADRYLTLAGYNISNGQYEPYDTIPSPPDDQRFLMASGPFDIMADSIASLVFAVFFADWINEYGFPDTAFVPVDAGAQFWYEIFWREYLGIKEHSVEPVHSSLVIAPNPVVNNTHISFTIPVSGNVSLRLYNVAGQLVRTFMNEYQPAAVHGLNIDMRGLSQGMYFLVLESAAGKNTGRFVKIQ